MKQLTPEELYRAMNGIGEDLLENSETKSIILKQVTKPVTRWMVTGVIAAALFLVVLAGQTMRKGKEEVLYDTAKVETAGTEAVLKKNEETEKGSDAGNVDEACADESEAAYAQIASKAQAAPEERADMAAATQEMEACEDAKEALEEILEGGVPSLSGFTYQNRFYEVCEQLPYDGDLLGEEVATITEGGISGHVYTLKGEGASAVLCMISEDTIYVFRVKP